MESFRCYDNSDVIATLVMTNFHLNTTVVAIFPNVCLWRRSLCSDLVLTLKNCIEPPRRDDPCCCNMALNFLFDSFVKIWATCEMFLGKWFIAPLAKNFPYAYDLNLSILPGFHPLPPPLNSSFIFAPLVPQILCYSILA